VWSAYPGNDPAQPAELDHDATAGVAPPEPAGTDPQELVIDGEHFTVTRRAGSPGTYDFDWTSHPIGYGFSVGGVADGSLGRVELEELIRDFLSEIDTATGYLRD